MLRVGGRLVVTDWCDDYVACRVCDSCLRLFSPAHVKMYGGRECAQLLHEAGHALVDVEKYKISWLWGLMTATAHERKRQPDAITYLGPGDPNRIRSTSCLENRSRQ